LLGGLRELTATTVEDGGDVDDVTEAAIDATMRVLGPAPDIWPICRFRGGGTGTTGQSG
jgi:hypothetical protein